MGNDIDNKAPRSAARGTVHLLMGRIYFMAAGYVVAVLLARGLGPAAYGVYGLIMSMLLWLNVASDFGVQRATIKLISSSDAPRDIARTAFACLVVISITVFAVCWIAAPAIARSFGIDDGAWLIRIAIIDIPINGFYIAYQGVLQGHRRFGTVATAFVLYSTAKLLGVSLIVAAGATVASALVVNFLSTVVPVVFFATRYRPGVSFAGREHVRTLLLSALPIGLYIVINRFVLSSHLWSLGWLGDVSDETLGHYVAAWTVAQLPTLVTFVITGVLLASISGALARNDTALAHRYLQSATRFVAVTVLPMCALGALDARPIMHLIFSSEYAESGPFLAVLLFAYGMFSMLDTIMHAMLAKDQHHRVAAVQSILVPIAMLLNYLLIVRFGATGAAAAVLATLTCGVVVAMAWSGTTYGSPLRGATAVRVVVATSIACVISWFWQVEGFLVLVKLACLVVIYGVILLVLRELGPDDLKALAIWKKA